jgi:hypothetical protein
MASQDIPLMDMNVTSIEDETNSVFTNKGNSLNISFLVIII